jgi:anaerobic magnesium-protoporphyrin IX monomethyl ester cyclase
MKVAFVSLDRMNVVPPLGLATIISYLEEKLPLKDYKVIDANYDDVLTETINYKPDLVAISATTIDYAKAIDYADSVKKNLDCTIIIGGVHITYLPLSLKKCFDVGVIGEGEETALEVFKLFKNNSSLPIDSMKSIRGIVYHDSNAVKITPPRPCIEDLDSMPMPNLRVFNKQYWKPRFDIIGYKYSIYGDMISSKGCPFNCKFCASPKTDRKVRFKSAERVVQEMKYLVEEFGVKNIFMEDDLFTINVSRINKIHDLMKKEGILTKLKIACTARSNTINDEICSALKRINVILLSFGFESGNERMLKYLKGESISIDAHKKAIGLCNKHQIMCIGSVIMGSPTETIAEMKDTVNFLRYCRKNHVALVRSYITTPFPGSFFWDMAVAKGKVSSDMDWHEYSKRDFTTEFSIEHPILLDEDIPFDDFKKVFNEGRSVLASYRYKLWFKYLFNAPYPMMKIIVKNPMVVIKKFLTPKKMEFFKIEPN